jgi:hypothetical protein
MEISKRLLGVWRAMHNRCYNKSQASYVNYGGRGIAVDACWHGSEGFKRFLSDMGPCPEGGTIERINNDGNYGPSNCRWATRAEQSRNRRNNRFLTANGQTKTLKDWANQLGCNSAAILYRLKKGMPEQEAVTMPIPERPNSKLEAKDALFVRKNYPTMTAQALATKLGVSKKTVLNIIHGKTFADVVA